MDLLNCSSPADFLKAARALRKEGTASWKKLAVLASHSLLFIDPYLVVSAYRARTPIDPWFAPFGQFEQIVLSAESELWKIHADTIWLSLRLEDIERWLPDEYYTLGSDGAEQKLLAVQNRLVGLVREIRKRSVATIFVSNFALPRLDMLDQFSASDPRSLKYLVNIANRELAQSLTGISDAWIFDYAGAVSACGSEEWDDANLNYAARIGIAAKNMPAVANRIIRCVTATRRPAAKCVVVDLDNTLWGGEIGDDGIAGIALGQDYPGSAYRDVQMFLKGLRSRGLLLAISSKNENEVALGAIDAHPDMILRSSDFASIQISRNPKPESLRRIASELNIGVESLVFIDDNPVERAQVRIELPQVCVPEMPQEVGKWLRTLDQLDVFDRPGVTTEDKQRAEMYIANRKRKELQNSTGDLTMFLDSLEMKARVGLCDDHNIERIHQLVQKTNQFNLTTRRYEREELRNLTESAGSVVAWLRLNDRYGDQGLVCVGVVNDSGSGIWDIDCFLMSCRVIGRQVEDAFLAFLREIVGERGGHQLRGKYVANGRNTLVANFYQERGFAPEAAVRDQSGKAACFLRSVESTGWVWPAVIIRDRA